MPCPVLPKATPRSHSSYQPTPLTPCYPTCVNASLKFQAYIDTELTSDHQAREEAQAAWIHANHTLACDSAAGAATHRINAQVNAALHEAAQQHNDVASTTTNVGSSFPGTYSASTKVGRVGTSSWVVLPLSRLFDGRGDACIGEYDRAVLEWRISRRMGRGRDCLHLQATPGALDAIAMLTLGSLHV